MSCGLDVSCLGIGDGINRRPKGAEAGASRSRCSHLFHQAAHQGMLEHYLDPLESDLLNPVYCRSKLIQILFHYRRQYPHKDLVAELMNFGWRQWAVLFEDIRLLLAMSAPGNLGYCEQYIPVLGKIVASCRSRRAKA